MSENKNTNTTTNNTTNAGTPNKYSYTTYASPQAYDAAMTPSSVALIEYEGFNYDLKYLHQTPLARCYGQNSMGYCWPVAKNGAFYCSNCNDYLYQ